MVEILTFSTKVLRLLNSFHCTEMTEYYFKLEVKYVIKMKIFTNFVLS